MTNEDLVYRIQNSTGDVKKQSLEELYRQNKGLIAKAAKKYKAYAEFDDLMQEGYIGLCNAADSYEPGKGATYATYAYRVICGTMLNYLRNSKHLVYIPAHIKAKVSQYRKILEVYQKTSGEIPSINNIAVLMGVTPDDVEAIAVAAGQMQTKSLSDPVPETDDMKLEDSIADPVDRIGELVDNMADQVMNRKLWQCVDSLGGRQAEILRMKYQDGKTYSDIADEYGVSLERIRQDHNLAIKRIQTKPAFKEIRLYFQPNYYQKTGLNYFRNRFSSMPEEYVIRLEEKLSAGGFKLTDLHKAEIFNQQQ